MKPNFCFICGCTLEKLENQDNFYQCESDDCAECYIEDKKGSDIIMKLIFTDEEEYITR